MCVSFCHGWDLGNCTMKWKWDGRIWCLLPDRFSGEASDRFNCDVRWTRWAPSKLNKYVPDVGLMLLRLSAGKQTGIPGIPFVYVGSRVAVSSLASVGAFPASTTRRRWVEEEVEKKWRRRSGRSGRSGWRRRSGSNDVVRGDLSCLSAPSNRIREERASSSCVFNTRKCCNNVTTM